MEPELKRNIHREPVAACMDAAREASDAARDKRIHDAAPEMLAALRSLVEMCAAAGYEDDNDGMREARAAIARAEGRG